LATRHEPVWHPIQAAREVSPGRWFMIAHLGEPYGEITMVKRGDQCGYRADRTDETGTVIKNVGYFTTLKRSAWEIHSAYLRSHGAPSRSSYSG
jgi:hypothetical protein